MTNMFASDSALTEVDIASWHTGTNNQVAGMFLDCYNLVTLWTGTGWTESFVASDTMFRNCRAIKGAGGQGYDYDSSTPGSSSYAIMGTTGYLSCKQRLCDPPSVTNKTSTAWWSLNGEGDLVIEPADGSSGQISDLAGLVATDVESLLQSGHPNSSP